MERTISVWSDRNLPDQLWRWSTVTGLVISVGRTEMSLSICQNCCPQYRSFLSCLQAQVVSNGKWSSWVKHDISNSLNQLQFFSIFDICHYQCQITDATRHVGEKKCVKSSYNCIKVRENQRINCLKLSTKLKWIQQSLAGYKLAKTLNLFTVQFQELLRSVRIFWETYHFNSQ